MKAAEFALKVSGVQKQRRNNYTAVCPVCRESSLSFGDGKNGLTLGCLSGCDAAAILAVFGLKLNDLLNLGPDEAWLRRQLNDLRPGE